MKKIGILGSTGSIGTQTLEVVRDNDDIQVAGLAAGSNIELLEKQIREFKPEMVSVMDEAGAKDLAVRIRDTTTRVSMGMDGMLELAALADMEYTKIWDLQQSF